MAEDLNPKLLCLQAGSDGCHEDLLKQVSFEIVFFDWEVCHKSVALLNESQACVLY